MGSVTLKLTSQRMLWPKEPATAPLKVYRPDTAKANTQAMARQLCSILCQLVEAPMRLS